jgi:hypothetical protein
MTRIGIAHEPSPGGDDCGGTDLYLRRVTDALSELGEVTHLALDATFSERLTSDGLDIVCNLAREARGASGREAVAAVLEQVPVAFTGGASRAFARTASRPALQDALLAHSIPVAASTVLEAPVSTLGFAQRRFPMTVFRAHDLPPCRHRVIVRDLAGLEAAVESVGGSERTSLTVESVAAETTFACVLLGNGRSRTMLPPVTLEWSGSGTGGALAIERLPSGMVEEFESQSRRAFEAVGCRDIGIVEMGLTETGVSVVVSVDPLPLVGCTRSDDVVSLASSAAGVGMREVVQRWVLAAAERSRVRIARAPVLERLPRFTPPRGQPVLRPAQRA